MGAGRDAVAALAAAVAVAAAFAGFGWREWRARRVHSADDVARTTGLRLFGTLPAAARPMRRRLAGVNPPASDRTHRRLTEAADATRTQLLHEAGPRGMRLLMVTGADRADGKTSLAVLLAVSLARAWRRTLLIDANLRRPAAHRVFGLAAEPGLAELLRGEATADQVTQATRVSRLWALPAGRGDDHALQALAQDDVGPLLADLRGRYDFVIIDTPPVLPFADALMLARHADATLLAVLRGVSRLPPLEAARTRLEAVGARLLGAVVLGAPAP
jgi:tyrosine-protein kinase Etk/Wzc